MPISVTWKGIASCVRPLLQGWTPDNMGFCSNVAGEPAFVVCVTCYIFRKSCWEINIGESNLQCTVFYFHTTPNEFIKLGLHLEITLMCAWWKEKQLLLPVTLSLSIAFFILRKLGDNTMAIIRSNVCSHMVIVWV